MTTRCVKVENTFYKHKNAKASLHMATNKHVYRGKYIRGRAGGQRGAPRDRLRGRGRRLRGPAVATGLAAGEALVPERPPPRPHRGEDGCR